MRPTASSASKVNEKVEPKSPPKPARTVAKPARKSGDKLPDRRLASSTSRSSQPAEKTEEDPFKQKEPEVAVIEHELTPPREEPISEESPVKAPAPSATAPVSETPSDPAANTVEDGAVEVPAKAQAEPPTEVTATSTDVSADSPAEARRDEDAPKEVATEDADFS